MSLQKGNSACTSGLSKRIYDNVTSDPNSGFSSPLTTAQNNSVKSLCFAIASAVVDEIQANAATSTIVNVGGLQKTPSPNNPATATDAPASPVTLGGTVT